MRTTKIFLGGLLALSVTCSLPAIAQDEQTGPTTRELVESELEDLRVQLALPEYTWNQVRLILRTGIHERVAISRKYSLDATGEGPELSSKEQRRMRKDLKRSRKSTTERMERYLDKDQMKAFKAVQEDIDAEFLALADARAG